MLKLKIRGRIVGAISRCTLAYDRVNFKAIYTGVGLLAVAGVLMLVVLISVKDYRGAVVRTEQIDNEQVTVMNQDQPSAPVVVTQVVPVDMPRAASTAHSQIKESTDINESTVANCPLKGSIKLDFGWQQHEVYNDWRYHTGVDISGAQGKPVQAVYSGEVTDIYRDRDKGLTVVIKNNKYTIYYSSLSAVTVSKGDNVSSRTTIGTIGSCYSEPYDHLHLAIKKGEQYIDPKLVMSKE